MKTDLKALVQEHGLSSISVTLFADTMKYFAVVQWDGSYGKEYMACDRLIGNPDDAVRNAVAKKVSLDAERQAGEISSKKRRIQELRNELAALEGGES